MREVVFIKKNEKVWKDYDAYLRGEQQLSADDLAEFYIQITDDLSYAKTFYPKSKALIEYLNRLALASHQSIYRNKREESSRFINFWRYEVPMAIRESHKEIFISLIIFLSAIGVGVFSTWLDPEFPRMILGDQYVNMTLDNIARGNPMAVYESADQEAMFFFIGSNNIKVSFMAYIMGIFGSVFSGLILVYNGIMVGAFQTFFVQQDLFWLSFSTIFIHGALELSEIVITGGAGLVLGNSLLFPGTYSRRVSLIRGAKRSLKIVIGSVPVVIIAAIIESYVTRQYMSLGDYGRLAIIVISFAYVIWYYYFYPIIVEKKLNQI